MPDLIVEVTPQAPVLVTVAGVGLTGPAGPQDTTTANNLTAETTRATAAEGVNATAIAIRPPRWISGTAYTIGQQVISPNNDVVSSIATHTSGSSFTAANWNLSTSFDLAGSATLAVIADQTRQAAKFAGLIQLAKNPDTLVVGTVTGDPLTSASVIWPDGSPGTLTITARHTTGAVTSYNITYGSPVTKTFTQPAITRATSGAATNVPQIVIS